MKLVQESRKESGGQTKTRPFVKGEKSQHHNGGHFDFAMHPLNYDLGDKL